MHAPASELANRGIQFRPRVEDTYGKPQCCPLIHSVGYLSQGLDHVGSAPAPDRPRHISVLRDRGVDPDQSWKVAGEAVRMGARTRPAHRAERPRAPLAGRAYARP